VVALWAALAAGQAAAQPEFVAFESGPVRPLALTPDGNRLLAVNTPAGLLHVYDLSSGALVPTATVPVGMEPVAVAVAPDGRAWVVNHLSDSISIVDLAATPARVVRTLLVGDEPRDVVFGGPGFTRAFVTTAHRGQQRVHPSLAGVPGAGDPRLSDESVGRADVWVFDSANLGGGPGGVPLRIVQLYGDTPRALAVTPDGATVYAAILFSGNRTTTLAAPLFCRSFDPAAPCKVYGFIDTFGLPGPGTNVAGDPAPHNALIVQHDTGADEWIDVLGRPWNQFVRFSLPDQDVFALDAATLAPTASFRGVGTTLFNMVVHPTSGRVYVSNTESRNERRFEGPGLFAGTTVQGHLAESRITVLDGTEVRPRHLNSHIDYDTLAHEPGFDTGARLHSLATPLDMAISADGARLYVAAFGSSKVGVLPTAALDAGTLDPTSASADYVSVSGGGPAGLALDEARGRLYVWTRFDNGISTVDLGARREIAHQTFLNPEPDDLVAGRPVLYDALRTSANGEASCASCHVFGDLDHLGWDLGNPDDVVTHNAITILPIGGSALPDTPFNGTGNVTDFHPMKGPMTTQTLRGLSTHGAMHWRGDRSTGFFGDDAFDEDLSFRNFIVAFEGLLGRGAPLDEASMNAFTDFALQVQLPPNPNRPFEGLRPDQQAGRDFYLQTVVDGGRTCHDCHTLDPASGFFGSGTFSTITGNPQVFKVPQLRNAYTKVGMFGMIAFLGNGAEHKGDQIRGFGFGHDGSFDSLDRFLSFFSFPNATTKRQVEEFVLAFDTDVAAVVGQQVTLDAASGADVQARIDLLIARAGTTFTSPVLGGLVPECDLIVDGVVGGAPRSWLRLPGGGFQPDDGGAPVADAALRALVASEGPLTYTCVPPGSGARVGLDRDQDGVPNGLDLCPTTADADQLDLDGDLVGDACDPQSCGDGVVGALEACDDGNAADGDGCSSACTRESGAGSCEGQPSTCFVDRPLKARKLMLRRTTSGTESMTIDLRGLAPTAARGGADDPSLHGMTIELLSAGGGAVAFDLPAGVSTPGWRVRGSSAVTYKYVNPDAAPGPTPVRIVTLKGGRLVKIVGDGTGLPMDRAHGAIAVRVTVGRQRACGVFRGTAVVRDEPGEFLGRKATTVVGDCSAASLGFPGA